MRETLGTSGTGPVEWPDLKGAWCGPQNQGFGAVHDKVNIRRLLAFVFSAIVRPHSGKDWMSQKPRGSLPIAML